MSLYVLSDLHLSFGTDKPMDVFYGWENHTDRIKANWNRLINEEDTVILAGDISWALKLEETEKDFEFINSLSGKKIILKGNHDFWWSTVSKIKSFLNEKNFNTLDLLFNNSFVFGDIAVCGSRGWLYDGSGCEDEKIIKRECGRLLLSLNSVPENIKEKIVFMHYPPVYNGYVCRPIIDILKENGINQVYYGHIHGTGKNHTVSSYNGISMKLVSCDCVDFTPIFVR